METKETLEMRDEEAVRAGGGGGGGAPTARHALDEPYGHARSPRLPYGHGCLGLGRHHRLRAPGYAER